MDGLWLIYPVLSKKFDFELGITFNHLSKIVMFGFVKKIFNRSESADSVVSGKDPGTEAPASADASGHDALSQEIAIPLNEILDQFPDEAKSIIIGDPSSDVFVFLPRLRVTSQLAKGQVKLTVGEVRQLSPAGVFKNDVSQDEVFLVIPFPLIIQRLKAKNPLKESSRLGVITPISYTAAEPVSAPVVSLPREAKAEEPIISPPKKFQAPVSGMIPGSIPPPGGPPKAGSGIPVSPIAASLEDDDDFGSLFKAVSKAPGAKEIQEKGSFDSDLDSDIDLDTLPAPEPDPVPVPEPKLDLDLPISFGNKTFTPPKGPISPISPIANDIPSEAPAAKLSFGDGSDDDFSFAPPPPPGAYSSAADALESAHFPKGGFSVPAPSSPPPPAPAPAISDSETLDFTLSDLWKSWPENLKSGILSHEKATLSIPVKSLTPILQRGKAVFTWLETKDWFNPSIGHTLMGQEDKALLQFPMELLVPAYMKSQKGGSSAKPLSPPEMDSIPDLFGSRPQLVSSSAPEAQSADDRGSSDDQAPQADGLLVPAKLVQEALKLSEVIGAFLASSDGLLIHGELPDSMKKETFAAFIPQIYDRVSKYTKELRLGELNYLSLSIGETGMLILKSSEIYFAALGQQGKPLPLEALGGLMQRLKTN